MNASEFKSLSPSKQKKLIVNAMIQWMSQIARGKSKKLPMEFEGKTGDVVITNSNRGWIATVNPLNGPEKRNISNSMKQTAEFVWKSVQL